jgi:3-oxoadipate enol-lactonase
MVPGVPLPEIPDPLVQVTLPTGATVGVTDSGGDRLVVVFSHGLLMNHTMFAP